MPQLIKDGAIVNDRWTLLRQVTPDGVLPGGPVIVPLASWRAEGGVLRARGDVGVWLRGDDDPEALSDDIGSLPLIAVDFAQCTDGRGYSTARLLREKHGFTGELRAIGDVLRDQVTFMYRCGFDAYAVREDKDIHDALKAFDDFSVQYQGAVDNPSPLFRRREAAAQKAAT